MLNIMRSDLYRITKGKCLYITLIIFLTLTVIQAVFPGRVFWGLKPLVNIPAELDGMHSHLAVMVSADNIIYIMLSIIFVLAATDFSSGAVKNTLSSGVSRTKLYLSKLMLGSLICIIMYASAIFLSTLAVTLITGFGGTFSFAYMLSVLIPFAAQLVMLIGVISIGISIIFITKKGAALNAIYLSFFIGITTIIVLIARATGYEFLVKYDFVLNLQSLADVENMAAVDIFRALVIGMAFTVICTSIGILAFKKSEIK
jgi:ABC-type transport system involved in multi-copper enzyme maturation permease subunit